MIKSTDFDTDFDRFITSGGTETLILALTSKLRQSVAHNRHRIFLFGFCVRKRIYLCNL